MFDLYIPSTNTTEPQLYLRGHVISLLLSDFTLDTWNKVKIEFKHLNIKIYKNDTFLYELNPFSTNGIFQFRCDNSELSFKNFIIYSI